ncbi:putative RNA 2'-phosphotransferase [Pseudomonas syringae pv. maculicola]|uniref:Putative RNA 2'-phosphotransferase n=1 Tax=Pseudomonas syringae pv. maculicola TaxID=59511 RepID=A0A3M2WDA9_PSEYM|nr:putative RNA 2'-phosphotransferase [Pseudomonas syringae pv. maculicola]
MNKKQRDEISKLLSYVLRHAPESMGLTLDRDGWCEVDELVGKANANGHSFDRQALEEVVETTASLALPRHRQPLHGIHRNSGADRWQSASCSPDRRSRNRTERWKTLRATGVAGR